MIPKMAHDTKSENFVSVDVKGNILPLDCFLPIIPPICPEVLFTFSYVTVFYARFFVYNRCDDGQKTSTVRDPRQLLDCFLGDGGRESEPNETKKYMAGYSSILDYSTFWPILLSCELGIYRMFYRRF